jgi:glycosyltransferase involved in cell wall biosynthesis
VKRILVINFFPAFVPPSSGGELRYFHLYSRLSHHFDVTLLSPTYSNYPRELVTHSPTFREYRIPKASFEDQLYRDVAKENIAEEFSALISALASRHPNSYHQAYCGLQAKADLIIHEFPYMLEYDFLMGIDRRPRIYDSHNVESDLVAQMWKGPSAGKYLSLVEDLERRLITQSDACFSVSAVEARRFVAKYPISPRLFTIIENGIAAEEFRSHDQRDGKSLVALFFGSLHPPNIEAAQYILTELAPNFPQIEFVIAGNCLPTSHPGLPPNVQALGKVDDNQRLSLFANADIALNPMCSGAGTNLKALEYLAATLPMLSTPLGARGLDLISNDHALIADIDQFPGAFRELAANSALRSRLAASGRRHVVRRFSWDAIAQRAASAITAVLETHKRSVRRHILLLNDFSVAQPMGGGEVRINKLYTALTRHYDITMVCFGGATLLTRTEIAPGFIEIQVPKTETHRKAENTYKWHISAADIINYQEAPSNELLVSIVKAIAQYADAIVLSHPYMAGLLKYLVGLPVIYESHNVESELKRALLIGHPAYAEMTIAAGECEKLAISRSSELISVSGADFASLVAIGGQNDKIHLVPNGVDVPVNPVNRKTLESVRSALGGRPLLIFIGSAHPPNIDAANHIVRDLAPQLGNFMFGIIGSVCSAIGKISAPNVISFGPLDDLTKDVVLELADVALNPMLSGSGSNLKLADYFAKCLPTVTTPFGARGYDITNGVEAIVCPLDQFRDQLQELIAAPLVREKMAAAAYQFAKDRLDWQFQAAKYRSVLERGVFARMKKKLLVVTHRFTNPPLGGAESHLIDLLKAVERQGNFVIDLVTTDIAKIENQFHFSCLYERNREQPAYTDIASLKVIRFPVDELEPYLRLQNAARLWAAWVDESIDLSLAHLGTLPDAILLGGWYYPERELTGVSVWSSPRALLKVKQVKSITLLGNSNHKTLLTIFGDGRQISEMTIDGEFELKQPLNGVEVLELRLAAPYKCPDDPRELGVRIRKIHVESSGSTTFSLPLDISYCDVLKRVAPREYIRSLIDVARSRAAELDVLFQDTRGPNSSAMEDWLNENAKDYDVVLGHSLPFKTVVIAADAARAAGVPLVQLPSAHIDDAFYHWQSYFQALRSADLCITHPRSASAMFFEEIGVNSRYFPPGMEDKGIPSPADQRAFQALYQSEFPYVLVLGRKDRSKNYHGVIRAVSKLNISRRRCNVVMIGRDEDGEPLDGNLVQYLGAQPDGVVRSALRNSLCLVTMSESESFGIVILEAWSQGRPVIVSENCIASTELVVDGESGLVANIGNLADKIVSLLDNPLWAREMGGRGYARVQAEFRWEVIGAELNDVLLELSASGRHAIQNPVVFQ